MGVVTEPVVEAEVSPARVQRRRVKGWKAPAGAVYVGRGSKWGNPFSITPVDRHGCYPWGYRVNGDPSVASAGHIYSTEALAAERAAHLYRREIVHLVRIGNRDLSVLAGKDLMCWCPLDQPCHADVLLELANKEAS